MNEEGYTRKVIPHLKTKYFEGPHKAIFNEIVAFVTKFGKLPNGEALTIGYPRNILYFTRNS